MLGLVLVDFMDGDSGMDNRRLDGFLLDNGLDCLMHVSKARRCVNEMY